MQADAFEQLLFADVSLQERPKLVAEVFGWIMANDSRRPMTSVIPLTTNSGVPGSTKNSSTPETNAMSTAMGSVRTMTTKARAARFVVAFAEDVGAFLLFVFLLALLVVLAVVVRSCAPPEGRLFAPEKLARVSEPLGSRRAGIEKEGGCALLAGLSGSIASLGVRSDVRLAEPDRPQLVGCEEADLIAAVRRISLGRLSVCQHGPRRHRPREVNEQHPPIADRPIGVRLLEGFADAVGGQQGGLPHEPARHLFVGVESLHDFLGVLRYLAKAHLHPVTVPEPAPRSLMMTTGTACFWPGGGSSFQKSIISPTGAKASPT